MGCSQIKGVKGLREICRANVESILEAFAVREEGYVALPFALYEEDTLVGFCMLGYGGIGDDEEPSSPSLQETKRETIIINTNISVNIFFILFSFSVCMLQRSGQE